MTRTAVPADSLPSRDAHSPSRDDRDRLVVRGHAAVRAVAHDPTTYSSAVSRHLQIPNGLDGAAHTAARRLIDPFFAADEIDAFAPGIARIAADLVVELSAREFDAVADLGARFAVRAQSHWLGWPPRIEQTLLDWVAANRAATRSGDAARTAEVAGRFDGIIRSLLAERRETPRDDVTTRLTTLRTESGRRLDDAEIVSILRNWTGGDLSSMALCTGVLLHALATRPDEAAQLAAASDPEVDAAIDELLRLDDPFVSNRRVATRPAVVEGCPVRAGDVVVLDWRAANTDPRVFDSAYEPAGHAEHNLVWGTGIHVCPGRPLATRQLRILLRAVLAAGAVVPAGEPEREQPPVAGFRRVPVRLAA